MVLSIQELSETISRIEEQFKHIEKLNSCHEKSLKGILWRLDAYNITPAEVRNLFIYYIILRADLSVINRIYVKSSL